ncbi:barstar family protein [Hymenobacter properus]|uniref:Barstar family protein n=1 Tax=Hymenobacter properus TaxID=2791026 RepID=A0A931BIZ5_9BACT|nr:barstar family protein [Hymenobacter properus]MBF9143376.1 barstar family protein [Hymenobacter properus]MBR7722187.1 barstar family protein [Microvirga sp. SRT04]
MTIDLTHVDTKAAFHMLMKRELGFPDWYGVSWDAFWDAIIAVVEMPDVVVLEHWQTFAQACPKDMQILLQIIDDYQQEKPGKWLLLGS